MFRSTLTTCAVLLVSASVWGGEPKPLWEIETAGDKATAPGWLGYSPDGKAIVTVVVQNGKMDPPEYGYTLRVWDANTRVERFTANLGRGRTPTWGNDLVAFPTDDSILTAGESLTVRALGDGKQGTMTYTGATADHGVWFTRDVQETFHLRREPDHEGQPAQLFYRSSNNPNNEFEGRRFRGDNRTTRQTDIQPPRPELRLQSIALNSGRTRLVAAFRDDSTTSGKPRHALTHYRINTINTFSLETVAVATSPHGGSVSTLAFAQDGKTLATGGEDGTICLWDVKDTESGTWNPRSTLASGDHRVVSVAFSPDC